MSAAIEETSNPEPDRLAAWHRDLQDRRGERAGLRRAQKIDDVYGVLAFHGLLRVFPRSLPDTTAARIAIALAELNEDSRVRTKRRGEALGRAFAAKRNDKPRLSPERLRLLCTAEDPDQFLRLLRGAIGLLDRKGPLHDLAHVVEDWHWPESRARARRQLFLAYHGNTESETETTLPTPEKTDA